MSSTSQVSVLDSKTLDHFNVDVSTLNIGSHQKVFVKCNKCSEEFTREFRHKHKKHRCSTHIFRVDGKKLKWCNKCKIFLTYESFSVNYARLDGLNSYCKSCCNCMLSSKKKHVRSTEKLKTLSGWLKWAISIKKCRCRNDGIEFSVDYDYLENQWKNQNGRCYYSNIEMEFGKKLLTSASIERLDSKIGYIPDNVVWATKFMNLAKNDASEDDFLELLANLKNDIYSIPVRMECKILHENAKLPSRSRTTDAGYDICSVINTTIESRSHANIPTGIAMSCPPGYYYTIDGRSGMGAICVIPFRGIIDSGYTGQVMVILYNFSDKNYTVSVGDRIAQIILHKINHMDITTINEFSPSYNQRGTAGFGSSGK